MALPKIIVTGSNGQLGYELRQLASVYNQYQFIFLDRQEAPIEEEYTIIEILRKEKPVYFINCAAYTVVDKAEEEIERSNEINGYAVGRIALACKETGTKFIHISTDYVFDGSSNIPLKETDTIGPINQYGKSKLLGEELVIKNNPDSIIIRTSWVYSVSGKNFVHTMIRLMKEKKEISVVNDQIGSPTNAEDLAEVIMKIISSGKWVPGIYHYSNEGKISWFQFANAIKEQIHSTCVIQPIPSEKFPTPAIRPKFSLLDKEKIQNVYNVQLIDWKLSLEKCIRKIQKIN
jgi:dTDP-4-dehydrorhamnose reductase